MFWIILILITWLIHSPDDSCVLPILFSHVIRLGFLWLMPSFYGPLIVSTVGKVLVIRSHDLLWMSPTPYYFSLFSFDFLIFSNVAPGFFKLEDKSTSHVTIQSHVISPHDCHVTSWVWHCSPGFYRVSWSPDTMSHQNPGPFPCSICIFSPVVDSCSPSWPLGHSLGTGKTFPFVLK
jgi:hypothetical protein